MTSYEIRERIDKFLDNDDNEYLKELFRSTSKWFVQLTLEENEYVINRANTGADQGVLKTISMIDLELKNWKKGRLFRQIDKLLASIQKLEMPAVIAQFGEITIPDDDAGLEKYSLIHKMDFNFMLLTTFEAAYEQFLLNPNVREIFDVLKFGHLIHLQLTATSFALWDFRDQLDATLIEPISAEELELTIWLNGSDKLQVLASKFTSLNETYLELCHLLDISSEEYPLRIGKLETGSLWLKVFGENRVITLLVDGLREAAKYLYRTYTREGRFFATEDHAKILGSSLDLQPKLEAMGVDTTDLKEILGKSAALIAKNQLDFLCDESKIVINGESFSPQSQEDILQIQHLPRRFASFDIEPQKKKLLESGEPDTETES